MAIASTRDQQFRVVSLLAVALLIVAPLMYIVLVYILSTSQPMAGNSQPILFWVLLAVAILQVTVILPTITRVMRAKPQALVQAKPNRAPAVTAMIVRMALIESVFVYGLIYFAVTRELPPILYFYVVGMVAALLCWPTRERFDDLANALEAQ